jgi:pimeloyl-ACP methyl ester carboxylesterase
MRLELMLQNDEMKLFNLIYRYDNLKHSYYKESIGHDNPNKNNVPDDYEVQLKKLDREITQYIHDNPELTTIHSEWHGFETVEFFTSGGYEAILVKPDIAASGTPWAWRTEFFGAFPSVDIELVKKGWHIAHVRLPDLYGCDIAVDAMDKFHLHIVEKFKLKPQTVLFGFSRGGLYSVNYAARFPERVESLYLDAPVVDIRSWPKGEYSGTGAPYEWNQCTLAYGVNHNEEERINNVLGVLLEYRIPLVLVAGDSDQIVPYNENGKFLEDAYIKTNIPFKLIMKKGVGHHPHSLDNPEEIVNFLTFHSKKSPAY